MRLCSSGTRLRLAAGAIIVLWACLFVAPTKSEAGCSRYVTHRSGHERFIDVLLADSDDAGQSPIPAPNRPRPCSGPSCSENVPVPSAPSVSVTKFVEPWANLCPALMVPDLGTPLLHSSEDDPHPAPGVAAIFHPPRA